MSLIIEVKHIMHANINTSTDRINADFDNQVLLYRESRMKKESSNSIGCLSFEHMFCVYLLLTIDFS